MMYTTCIYNEQSLAYFIAKIPIIYQYYAVLSYDQGYKLVNTSKLLSLIHYLYIYTIQVYKVISMDQDINMDTAIAIFIDCNRIFHGYCNRFSNLLLIFYSCLCFMIITDYNV